jgi:ribosome maturation factor RimP
MDEIRRILLNEFERLMEPLGIHIVQLSVYRGKGGLNIRVVIYREGGVTLDDCERATRMFNDTLTILEPIDENNYTLQVSSPGIDRVFKDEKEYDIFIARHVKIIVDESYHYGEGGVIRGVLKGLVGDNVLLSPHQEPERELRIPIGSIKKTQLDG